ncbi:rna-directed dna polymerase from mobile element jockey-like [Willisornis vidua]|uniref:Rna-directed dna polymerase from mobile element jockey-like n=1 Tax=Willisornis vidua TaxID=1566151 RepID=A0ABQ9DC84_9PASS|nr:rna-directed dna polymerase from mobile element jockey-like [Willisornis vidua]
MLIFPLWKEMGYLDNLDKDKAEVLTDIFNGKCSGHLTQVKKGKCMEWENEDPQDHRTRGLGCQDHLRNLNVHKSKGPDEIHL